MTEESMRRSHEFEWVMKEQRGNQTQSNIEVIVKLMEKMMGSILLSEIKTREQECKTFIGNASL